MVLFQKDHKLSSDIFFSDHPSKGITSPRWGITFQMRLSSSDFLRYENSIYKRRLLAFWREFGPLIDNGDVNIYDLYSLIKSAYKEDFTMPFSVFSCFSWFRYIILLSQILHKNNDIKHWQAMSLFLHRKISFS